MTYRLTLIGGALLVSLMGCTEGGGPNREAIGGLSGAVVGGLVGDQVGGGTGRVLATGAGVLIGTLIGSDVGRQLDEVDRMRAEQAFRQSLNAPVGQIMAWQNLSTGHSGTFVVTRETSNSRGQLCRQFRHTTTVGGRNMAGAGTACLEPNGSWRVL